MLQVSATITNQRQADAWAEFQKAYLATEPLVVAKRTTPPAVLTPLEQAIAEASEPEAKPAEPKVEEVAPAVDPFAALSGGAPSAAEPGSPTEKPVEGGEVTKKRGRPKKVEAPATGPEAAEESAKLTLAEVRKASSIALELVGAPVIQEALAKFNAVDDKNVLRMSALREADYERYIAYLKKKANDAAKEWPES